MWLDPRYQLVPGFTDLDIAQSRGNHTGQRSGYQHPQREYHAVYELMNSEESRNSRSKWNDCQHYRRQTSLPRESWSFPTIYSVNPLDDDKWWEWRTRSRSYFWESIGGSTGTGEAVYGDWSLPDKGLQRLYYFNEDYKFVNILSPHEYNTLARGALNALLPGIRPRLSLLNSVYELKDFKSLPNTLSKIKNLGQTLLKGQVWGRKTLRRLLHSSADGYLQSEFNIKPLLSDIGGITTAIKGVRREVQKLLENEGKLRHLHWKTTFNMEQPKNEEHTSSDVPAYYGEGSSVTVRRFSSPQPVKFVATIQYQYELEPWARQQAELRGMLDALGVNVNPAIIWNAIPWSFVVDWVFGVGQWLDHFKTRNLEPRTRIHKFIISAKYSRFISTQYALNAKFGTSIPNSVQMVGVLEEAYVRLNRDPDLVNWFNTSGLSSHEFSLAAALIASKKTS